jgi:hypothetical protein
MTGYRQREIAGALAGALEAMPVVVLSGMRQTGKSTLLGRDPALGGRRYLSLDDFAVLEAARNRPEELLGDGDVTVDECQKCPELLTVIKRLVDQDRRPGRFLLSGSANLLLLKRVAESLAGRAVYLALAPFSRREISGSTAGEPFLVRCLRDGEMAVQRGQEEEFPRLRDPEVLAGGMPSVCLAPNRDPSYWFLGYEQTYLDRDVRELSQVADLVSFRTVLHLAAMRSGQILNISEVARDAKLTTATTTRYLNLLEVSFVLEKIPPYLRNPSARLIKSPKLFLTDSGLAAHLQGVKTLAGEAEAPMRGALVETYIAQNIAGICQAHVPEARRCYWSVQGRHEVDFVVEAGRQALAIEIKSASRWRPGDLSGLKAFLAVHPECRIGLLAYSGAQTVKLADRCWAVPLSRLLS